MGLLLKFLLQLKEVNPLQIDSRGLQCQAGYSNSVTSFFFPFNPLSAALPFHIHNVR